MDLLATQTHVKAIRKALDSLPQELDEAYDDAIKRIKAQSNEDWLLAQKIFSWITNAFRILTLVELQHALAIAPEVPYIDEEAIINDEILTSVCAGLVVIVADAQGGLIQLVRMCDIIII